MMTSAVATAQAQSSSLLQLYGLNLSNNKIGKEGIGELMDYLTSRNKKDVSEQSHDEFLSSSLFQLVKLDLSHTMLTDEGLMILLDYLPQFPCLQKLKLGFNRLTRLSMSLLANCYSGSDGNDGGGCIVELDLKHNDVCHRGLMDLLFIQSSPSSSSSSLNQLAQHLQVLDLTGNRQIGDQGLNFLSNLILNHPQNQLRRLILWETNLHDSSVKMLCHVALSSPHCKLQVLDLKSNHLTESCIEVLVDCLETKQDTCGSIVDLSVTGNEPVRDASLLKRLSIVLNRNKMATRNHQSANRSIAESNSIECDVTRVEREDAVRTASPASHGSHYSLDFAKCFALLEHVKARYKHEPQVYLTCIGKISLCANFEGVPIRHLYHQLRELFRNDTTVVDELSHVFTKVPASSTDVKNQSNNGSNGDHTQLVSLSEKSDEPRSDSRATMIEYERRLQELEEREKDVALKEKTVLFLLQRLSRVHEFRTDDGQIVKVTVKDLLSQAPPS